ncbi:MAG: glycosyltransferase [Candidatus Obscuribacterales bacterium]|nr:glycosyltransferase [Candidatus Obscuribacterales bacterium]
MNSPHISVCLPVFNGSKHLSAAIDSILTQSLGNFELLIADDGSSDGSQEILSDYARKDSRIRYWKNEARLGLFANYNACIMQATGKYIKPYAQDDLLEPDALERLAAALEAEPALALVSSARQIIDDNGKVSELKQPIAHDFRAAGKDVILFHLIGLNNWVGEPSTVMFRHEYRGSGFDNKYFHYGDIEYWFRVLLHGDYQYLSRPLASFRRHKASQTDKNHRELYFALDILRLSYSYRSYLQDIEPEELLKKRLSEKIALEQGHIFDAENLFEHYTQTFLSAGAGLAENSSNEALAAGFRLLASVALSTVSELSAELDHEKRCRSDEQDLFRLEVKKMQNSLYWKLSNPLRRLRDALKSAAQNKS